MENIHESHKMSDWENTIITIIDTPRFGRIRKCLLCGAEQAETAAGSALHNELILPCEGGN